MLLANAGPLAGVTAIMGFKMGLATLIAGL
jgi:hypothetical protein